MRSFSLFLFLFSFCFQSSAKDIPLDVAQQYAVAAYKLYAKDNRKSDNASINGHLTQVSDNNEISYYLFNFENGGFVILSADDNYHPVLGFSTEGPLDFSNEQAMIILKGEMASHEIQIAESKKANFKSSTNIISAWSEIKEIARTGRVPKNNTFQPVVAPLTTTKWNQDGFYNASTPVDPNGPNGRTYAGCVPIAMAQLLRYYENSAPGNGTLVYDDPVYGLQEGDICGQQFDYANMPDVLTEENTILSDFIYDIGKMTRTKYSTSYTSTYVSLLENSLVFNFGFDSDIKAYSGTNQDLYSSTLKSELDENRLVLLSGWSIDEFDRADIGHTWVADGYGHDAQGVEYMHFNWGWGGSNNGWFLDNPGAFTPHPNNPEQSVIPYYWYRYTIYNIKPAGEACSQPDQTLARSESFENYAYLYFETPLRDEMRRYRYKKVGTSDWITSDPTDVHFLYAGDLTPGTNYEYQVSRNCCGGWSSFSELNEFTTLGTAPQTEDAETEEEAEEENQTNIDCPVEDADGFFVTSLSDNFAFVYSTRPYGAVNNQFRYKKINSSNWTESDISNLHYRPLSGLDSGSTYEYQVRHECEAGTWSEYSGSFSFTTTGEATGGETTEEEESGEGEATEENQTSNDCAVEDADGFFVTSLSHNFAYVYSLTPYGAVNNQFRYKKTNSSNWTESDISNLYYRALSGLDSGSTYEYQVRHECEAGIWSEYSDSFSFTTNGESTGG